MILAIAGDAASQVPRPNVSGIAVGAIDSTTPAYRQFDRFLSQTLATRRPRMGYVDSLYTCGDEEGFEERRWIAAYRILQLTTRGDTGRVVVALTSVARQLQETDSRYGARTGILEDTASWRLVRNEETGGRWMTCGDSDQGFNTMAIGRSVRWRKGSAKRAVALADSIRKARGLPIVR